MAESNGVRLFLFVTFFTFAILPTEGVTVKLNTAENKPIWEGEIICTIRNGACVYRIGDPEIEIPKLPNGTKKVIYYIVDSTRFREIMHTRVDTQRLDLQKDLAEKYNELLYLQVEDFRADDEKKIHGFLSDAVRGFHAYRSFEINVITDENIGKKFLRPRLSSPETFHEEYEEAAGEKLKERLTLMKPNFQLKELICVE